VHRIVNTLGCRSLRALQDQAAGPVLDGAHALLLAPTAGGKTGAAIFPLLTAMDTQGWSGWLAFDGPDRLNNALASRY